MRTLSIAGISLVAFAAMTPAGAADRLIAAPAPIPIWSWTGFYVGSHIGQAWARKNWQSADGSLERLGRSEQPSRRLRRPARRAASSAACRPDTMSGDWH